MIAPRAADLTLARCRQQLHWIGVVDADSGVTQPGTTRRLRDALRGLGVDATVGGGISANFAEMNRMAFPEGELNFATFRISPQVHHTDDSFVMDTLLAQSSTVRDARTIAGNAPVIVGPVTCSPTITRLIRGKRATSWLPGRWAAWQPWLDHAASSRTRRTPRCFRCTASLPRRRGLQALPCTASNRRARAGRISRRSSRTRGQPARHTPLISPGAAWRQPPPCSTLTHTASP